MDDVELSILQAWKRIRHRLQSDPGELTRRLARRASKELTRPPRPWCIAIRANDSRLIADDDIYSEDPLDEPTAYDLAGSHIRTFYEDDEDEDADRARSRRRARIPSRQEITLIAHRLRRLCEPVKLARPGEPVTDVAKKLGRKPMGLLTGRLNGSFRHNYINGSGTWAGRRVALLYTEREIDPGARNFADAQGDRAWDWTARNLACYFPQRFIQTLTRIPLFHPRKPLGDEDELHPEHPAIDRVVSSRKKHSYKLPPPPPDPVPYKWKDGKFMGYDWRSPAHRKLYRKRQRALAKRRIRDRERRRTNPPDSKARGSLQFRGWRWRCPKCGRSCATLYLPIRRHNLLADFGGKFALPAKHQPPSVAPRFACHRCHRVRFFSRLSTEFWNQIVSYLSDGLLYGHEVPRPPWLTKDRKNAFAPRPNAKPSKRRPQVTELLLKGLKIKQIAAELGIAYWTVIEHLKTIYAQHGVRGKLALAQKLGRPIPDDWIPKQERVRRYLKAGWTYEDIAAELKITRHDVAHIAAVLRHQGHNIPRLVRPRRVRVEQ